MVSDKLKYTPVTPPSPSRSGLCQVDWALPMVEAPVQRHVCTEPAGKDAGPAMFALDPAGWYNNTSRWVGFSSWYTPCGSRRQCFDRTFYARE